MDNKTTHFGFSEVPTEEKSTHVNRVFDSVVNQYDLMNDLMSFGIHRLWKQLAILFTHIQKDDVVLDLAGGTGDLAKLLSDNMTKSGKLIVADINYKMLDLGRERLINQGKVSNIEYIQANAENLPFKDNSFALVTIGFGLRNVTNIDNALQSMFRIIKPGGCVIILEFSQPVFPGLKTLYDLYSFNVIPWVGEKIAHDKKSYQYLVESIRKHPDQNTLKLKMQQAGFEDCEYFNLTGGIVAIHKGYKY